MSWIKRNLAFVISLAVAVALLIGGVVYLFSAQSEAEAATGELEAKKNEYDTLVKREPYPNAKNIELAKAEQVRFNELKSEALTTFSQDPALGTLDDATFKALLTRTIGDLERSAERKGVKLPPAPIPPPVPAPSTISRSTLNAENFACLPAPSNRWYWP